LTFSSPFINKQILDRIKERLITYLVRATFQDIVKKMISGFNPNRASQSAEGTTDIRLMGIPVVS
jgi:hypothetical protein